MVDRLVQFKIVSGAESPTTMSVEAFVAAFKTLPTGSQAQHMAIDLARGLGSVTLAVGRNWLGHGNGGKRDAIQSVVSAMREHVFARKVFQRILADAGVFDELGDLFEGSFHENSCQNPQAVLAKALEQYPDLKNNLVEIQVEPISIASIGIVFKAKHKTEGWVAIKVQQPDLEAQIKSDMAFLGRFVGVLSWVGLSNEAFSTTVEAYEKTLLRELDYKKEAAWYRSVGDVASSVDNLEVPRVVYDTPSVLVTTWFDGQSLDKWAKTNPKPGVANQVVGVIVQLFAALIHKHCAFNSDLSLGNFLVSSSGTVGAIDFGAMVESDGGANSLIQRRVNLVQALISRSSDRIIRAYQEFGSLPFDASSGDKLSLTQAVQLMSCVCECLDRPDMDFRQQWRLEPSGGGSLGLVKVEESSGDPRLGWESKSIAAWMKAARDAIMNSKVITSCHPDFPMMERLIAMYIGLCEMVGPTKVDTKTFMMMAQEDGMSTIK